MNNARKENSGDEQLRLLPPSTAASQLERHAIERVFSQNPAMKCMEGFMQSSVSLARTSKGLHTFFKDRKSARKPCKDLLHVLFDPTLVKSEEMLVDEVEAIVKKDPGLLLVKFPMSLSDELKKMTTPLQQAFCRLNPPMWKMMEKYMEPKEIERQLKQHIAECKRANQPIHVSILPLIQAYNYFHWHYFSDEQRSPQPFRALLDQANCYLREIIGDEQRQILIYAPNLMRAFCREQTDIPYQFLLSEQGLGVNVVLVGVPGRTVIVSRASKEDGLSKNIETRNDRMKMMEEYYVCREDAKDFLKKYGINEPYLEIDWRSLPRKEGCCCVM